ncbi:probable trehalose-phosphate phosphatase 2 [Triticum aestivum]|uniref:probable trehalose-phosphate phosphatase 2 n=1 Tax=Triticum aestivum TaxID=4565 RepID=UPI001D012707|nr:probable trehalose-phosphate phosphatase 2 [Triticum aestivum]
MLIGNPRCVCPYFPKVLKPHAWGDHEMCAAVRHVAPLLQTAIISGRSHDMASWSHGMDITGLIRNSEFSGHHAERAQSLPIHNC